MKAINHATDINQVSIRILSSLVKVTLRIMTYQTMLPLDYLMFFFNYRHKKTPLNNWNISEGQN